MVSTKIFLLFLVLGLAAVASKSLSQGISPTNDLPLQLAQSFSTPDFNIVPYYDKFTLILDLINNLIGFKGTALSLAAYAIQWLVSNFFVVASGAIGAIGFCKLTSLCSLGYEEFAPIRRFRSLLTSEQLDAAENFLKSAIEKYAVMNSDKKLT